jgi:lipopolysaccharide/colanic/teichoic acid biosynthesis glycosyltransferase
MNFKTNESAGEKFSVKPSTPLPRGKRIFDIACCIIALPILAVFTLIMTILMRFTSPGPVFFCQERVGYLGRRFKCYKFRTMTVGADTAVHQAHCERLIDSNAPMVKMDARGDSRLIPLGWLVRASGIDELPQLINVLRGEMSLVGPRPCVPYEYEKYQPWQRERFSTLPGLTGLWQVSGKNRTTFEQMIRLDIYYAQNKSLLMDAKIIVSTVPALIMQVVETRLRSKSPNQSPATTAVWSAVPFPMAAETRQPFPTVQNKSANLVREGQS